MGVTERAQEPPTEAHRMKEWKLLVACSLLFVAAAMWIGACEPYTPTPDAATQDISHILYQRDPRNGLCFALLRSGTYSGYTTVSFTLVPDTACGKAR